MIRSAVVCGGGLAGLAAATRLSEAGVAVTLLESEPYLGGRVASWPDRLGDGTRFQMERGFHAFFRQYYNLRQLMMRADPALGQLQPMDDYPIYGPEGTELSFQGVPKATPWNLVEVVKNAALGLSDLRVISKRNAAAMLAYGPHTYQRWDHVSAADYLDSLNFPPAARQMLFDVFSHSFFNREEEFSAAELLMQFHFYFTGNAEGLVFDTLRTPFGRGLIDPLRAYLIEHGVQVRCSERVEAIRHHGRRWSVVADDEHEADAVVLALNVPGLQQLIGSSPQLGTESWRNDIEQLEVSWPFVVWRLWLDRPVRSDRPAFAGTAGMGLLDNVSVYEKIEDESAAWSARTGGSVVELHAYAVPPQMDDETIRRELLQQLDRLYPETASATVIEERYLRRRDCPAFRPGSFARRPAVQTPVSTLMLAGDFVRLDIPSALMERAVASGFEAANALLQQPIRLHSVPAEGMLGRLRW